jgi:ATP-dependent DNA ligase
MRMANANGKMSLYSRKHKSFSRGYQHVFDALRDLPQNSVVDGEIVALDDAGRLNFNFLQHSRSQAKRVHYFVFDLLIYENHDLTTRRECCALGSAEGRAGDAGGFLTHLMLFPAT